MNLNAGVGKRIQSSGVYNFSAAGAAALSFATAPAGDVIAGESLFVAGFINTKESGTSWGADWAADANQSASSFAEDLARFISGNVNVKAQAVGNRVHIFYENGGVLGSVESVTPTGNIVARIIKAEMGRANDPAIIEVEGTYGLTGAAVPDGTAVGVSVELPMCWVQSDADATLKYIRKGD